MGRFCLNCGHRIGEPVPAAAEVTAPPTADPSGRPAAAPTTPEPQGPEPQGLPVQAADPTPVPPVTPVDPVREAPAAPTRPVPPPRPQSQWDPREDLLPYEEVDDLERDSPLPGRAWIAWVLGAVLLVGLVVVLLRAFGTDGEETATDPAVSETSAPAPAPDQGSESPVADSDEETGSEPAEGPTGVGKRFEMAPGGTFDVPDTAPPTTDFDGNLVAYEASQMNDGNLSTAWRTAGDATGQTVTLTLAEPGVVQRVGLVNGYSKLVAGVDWYPNNRRIVGVTWVFEDGSSLEQTFAERPGLQMIKVPPVLTSTIGIQLTAVTPPGSGNLGRDYTAISEVSVIGRRAG
ncbi:hypothetical protein SAMN05192575_10281 [Nocardioides alpinus]|uniref:NAD glycohydrolase translocation F5/8 type C domain-containing protein n=1 Tax=Nocardioides alpinus TaxID=748909 RepID=A0A1I0X4J6_9ACTN|nr:hypothetical protein CXG46_00450 [Nocardioides alpinus]SFA94973.1 hypothetical protein SAMN05192575_10281 [Nocardioides alpinus]